MPECHEPALKRLPERSGIKPLHGIEAFGAENGAGVHRANDFRALRYPRLIDEAFDLFRTQLRDRTDWMARLRRIPQKR